MEEVNLSPVLRSGIYILRLRGRVVFVGMAKNVLARVYGHRKARVAGRDARLNSIIPPILFDEVFLRPCRVDQLEAAYTEVCAELNYQKAA